MPFYLLIHIFSVIFPLYWKNNWGYFCLIPCIYSVSPLYYIRKELVYIYIEIQKPNRFKDLLHKIFNKSEDMLFSIIQKIPEKFIPACLMTWIEHYTNKRISELKQQIIRKRWQTIELEKAVDNIHQRQQS